MSDRFSTSGDKDEPQQLNEYYMIEAEAKEKLRAWIEDYGKSEITQLNNTTKN